MAKWGSSIQDRIKCCIARHPAWPAERVNNSIAGSNITMVRAIMAGGTVPVESTTVPKSESSAYVSLDKIRARYDIAAAIDRELLKLPRGKLISEAEFCQRVAGYDKNRFRRSVENNDAKYSRHRVKLRLDEGDPKWFWGHQDDIAEAQGIRDL
jgi:hypothetical protein